MFIKCVDAEDSAYLTEGKVYETDSASLDDLYVKVMDDAGGLYPSYYSRRFVQVDKLDSDTSVDKKDMKYDADKPRMDLLLSGCPLALEAVSSILTFGAKKYSAHSWQTVERGDERYLAALLRHLTSHAKGESTDPESGMSHLAHAACNAMFILELELKKNANAG